MRTLVDTNVLSEARRPKGNAKLKRALAAAAPEDLYVSVITLGEIAHGVARLPGGRRRRELEQWLDQVETLFADRVLLVTPTVARAWGELTAALTGEGRTLHAADGLIAATALVHGLTLLTRNAGDFVGTGVNVVDPARSDG